MSNYLSVSTLTKYIKYKFDRDPHLQSVLIKGELSNFKRHSSGHLYFNVKDDQSVINAMMFKGNASKLDFDPKEGDQVLIEARVSVFEKRGNYQIYVNKMHQDGVGNLYQRLEQLKKKLNKEGLFDNSAKKPLPTYPTKIAVLTANTGAAIRDIHSTLNNRYPLAEQIHISTLVQGQQAKDDIIKNLKYADQLGVDIIIVGRGGGSIEDLWNFNEEEVARTIYACKTPIISAVGHETDFTISDFVADARAATPTQAAVMATPDQFDITQRIKQMQLNLSRAVQQNLKSYRKHLEHTTSYYKLQTPTLLYDQQIQRRDELEKQLIYNVKLRISQTHHHFNIISQKLNVKLLLNELSNNKAEQVRLHDALINLLRLKLTNSKHKLQHQVELLNNLSPTNTMLRGYAIAKKEDNVVTSTHDINNGDRLFLEMKDGTVETKVEEVRCKDE
ncbi:exodeoxyribonuclease VII large subunit [Staphylococcus sp. SQ8-PEA]|uniref:Exodeoxyribonuclease 7 large subunit n=1 Tax=Staphylococcus marylandisciuri TaxID=2981529 RepID=A0ABT2QQW6_9STAP|nr:exodeoxyribonuclease VII large subunit [Staphylococcus marylandisciuri]MCU5746345.1 exodeoxyribonuclease VII large subunit [Staphylococcus marylandisciuri]